MRYKLIDPKYFKKQIQHLKFKSKKKTKGPKKGNTYIVVFILYR